jgi:hypothetical protein
MTGRLKLDAWIESARGAGRYRNLETGLERKFNCKPQRGKWVLVRPRRTYLHVEGSVIRFQRREP